MKSIFVPGDKKIFYKKVSAADIAQFDSGKVHEVYATFSLARDAEWACRLFVLDIKEEQEEGIGTALEIKHLAPAFVGETIVFTATLEQIENNKVRCSFTAMVGNRLVATGTQTQKILLLSELNIYFLNCKNND